METQSMAGTHEQAYRSGYSLPQQYYVSDAQFEQELDFFIEQQWHLVDHESAVPDVGDYLRFDLGVETVIVLRDSNGEIRAHHNVCRHRGSVICRESKGNARVLVCPYHAWSYDLNGRLLTRRDMPADFATGDNGLHPCHVRVFHGLIFVCLSKREPPDFKAYSDRFEPFLEPFDLANTKIAARKQLSTHANWKLCFENFIECYHCLPSHKAYSRVHDVSRQNLLGDNGDELAQRQASWEDKAKALGTYVAPFQDEPDAELFQTGLRWEIGYGHVSGSDDGKPVAPLMGDFAGVGYDGGHSYCLFGPLLTIGTYPDHVLLFRFLPRGALDTDTEIIWLVKAGAQEGQDYDLERLTSLWSNTFAEDKIICEDNQRGVLSSAYQPGRYSLLETRTTQFADWYIRRFAADQGSASD